MAPGSQSSAKEMVTPLFEPSTVWAVPTCLRSAPLFSRKTVISAGTPVGSLSVTVMRPFVPSQAAEAENSLMSQASAVPAALSARAAEAAVTPSMRTEREAVRRERDTFVLYGKRNCGGWRGRWRPRVSRVRHHPQQNHRSISVP